MPILKFRYWDPFNGVMVYSENAKNLRSFFAEYEQVVKGGNGPIMMQYIGLKDKNGKEIYEGDILRVGYLRINENNREEWEYPSIHIVEWGGKWDYPAFDLDPILDVGCNGLSYIMNAGELKCEVIGNIYENSELLEVKES